RRARTGPLASLQHLPMAARQRARGSAFLRPQRNRHLHRAPRRPWPALDRAQLLLEAIPADLSPPLDLLSAPRPEPHPPREFAPRFPERSIRPSLRSCPYPPFLKPDQHGRRLDAFRRSPLLPRLL